MKYPFEQCFGSRVRSLSRKIDQVYRKHLGDADITENQLSIMMVLYQTGQIEQKQIGHFLHLEKSSLSRNLIRLIKAGIIEKSGPINRPLVVLTKNGTKKVEYLTPRWEMAMDEIHAILSDADVRAFNRFEKSIKKL